MAPVSLPALARKIQRCSSSSPWKKSSFRPLFVVSHSILELQQNSKPNAVQESYERSQRGPLGRERRERRERETSTMKEKSFEKGVFIEKRGSLVALRAEIINGGRNADILYS